MVRFSVFVLCKESEKILHLSFFLTFVFAFASRSSSFEKYQIKKGTVRDAYSKITVGFRGYMEQRRCSNRNVQTVLGGNEDIRIEMPRQPRVAVHSVGIWGISNRQNGFKRGDILTHISGQSVEKLNARQVAMKLKTMQQHHHRYGRARQPKTVLITLNAERSVAEALKRRSMALEEILS